MNFVGLIFRWSASTRGVPTIAEVQASYAALKPRLPTTLKTVRVHIFLVPIECVATLTEHFTTLMGG